MLVNLLALLGLLYVVTFLPWKLGEGSKDEAEDIGGQPVVDVYELQIPVIILRNLLVDSFLMIFLASAASVSASFSKCFTHPEAIIFLRTLVLSVKDTRAVSKNFFVTDFSSGSSSCRIRSTFSSSRTNRLRFLWIDIIPDSVSAAISRTWKDLAFSNFTSSGMKPASPIAFLIASDNPES